MAAVELVEMKCPADELLFWCTKYENHEKHRGDLLEKSERCYPACGDEGMLTGRTKPKG